MLGSHSNSDSLRASQVPYYIFQKAGFGLAQLATCSLQRNLLTALTFLSAICHKCSALGLFWGNYLYLWWGPRTSTPIANHYSNCSHSFTNNIVINNQTHIHAMWLTPIPFDIYMDVPKTMLRARYIFSDHPHNNSEKFKFLSSAKLKHREVRYILKFTKVQSWDSHPGNGLQIPHFYPTMQSCLEKLQKIMHLNMDIADTIPSKCFAMLIAS